MKFDDFSNNTVLLASQPLGSGSLAAAEFNMPLASPF
jgi:hypothetical protein